MIIVNQLLNEFGAVVPALNEAERINRVLHGLKSYLPKKNIVIVDDGSTDETAAIALEEGVQVISHARTMGKGASLRTGFGRILECPGIEALLTLDADGQHDPGEIGSFVEIYRQMGADIVIGSRMADTSGMPVIRKMTNRITSLIISARAGCRIDDTQSGYRLIRCGLLRRITLITSHFETESELLIKAASSGARIVSVPIKTIYAGERSKIRPFNDTGRFISIVARSFFW